MRPLAAALAPACAIVALAACAAEPEPVANRFARTNAEIENKARAFEAEVENEIGPIEDRLGNEANAFLNANSQSNASALATANVATANSAR